MNGSVLSIVIGNIVSKGLGVVREILFANWFGTGNTAAAFRIAQTGFLMPTHALVGDTLGASLLPLYQKMQRQCGEGHRVLLLVATLYGVLFSAVITTAILLYAEIIVRLIAPGASGAALEQAASLLHILALATPFYVLSSILAYLETAYGRYGAIAWRPALFNIGSTIGVMLAAFLGQEHWLATSLLLAHIAFFIGSLMMLARLDRLTPRQLPPWRAIADVGAQFLRNTAPLLGLPLLAQSNVLVERMVSSWIGTSVIPSVDYARFVADTAVQLIAVPLGVLTMSRHGGSALENMRHHVTRVASVILVLAVPLSAYIATHAVSVTRLLFARGAFDEHSVAVTSAILTWMGAALGATVLAYYLVKALNAQLRNLEALWCALIGSGVSISINLALWQVFGAATIGVAAAGGSIVMLLFAALRLQLIGSLLPFATWLALGASLVCVGGRFVGSVMAYPLDLVVGAALAGTIWVVLFILVPSLQELLWPAIRKALRRVT